MSIYLFRPLEASANPPFIEAPFVSTATWIHHESIIGGFFFFCPVKYCSACSVLCFERFVHVCTKISYGLLLCAGSGDWIIPVRFVTRSGGIAWRYFVDFSWAFVFASLPAFAAVMDYAASVRDTWRGKLVYSTVSIIALYQILILLTQYYGS